MGKIIKIVSAILAGGLVGANVPGEVTEPITNPEVANYINIIIGAALSLLMLWLNSWKKPETLDEN